MVGLGTPPPPSLATLAEFKIQITGGRLTSTHMLRTDTHLGLILSGNFLIGSLAESLLSESSVRTIRTSSVFSANKKQEKSISFKLN